MTKVHVLAKGSSVVDELLKIAKADGIKSAKIEAIGGVDSLTIAYFSREKKRYEEHTYTEFLEVTSLLGNISLKDGKPFLHLHGNFGRRDMTVIGGHVISGRVFPTLEVKVTLTENIAVRSFDSETGLNLIKGFQRQAPERRKPSRRSK